MNPIDVMCPVSSGFTRFGTPCGCPGAWSSLTAGGTDDTLGDVDAPRKTFWSKGRRRALSTTALTLFQILLGGTVLGGVLGKFGPVAKGILVGSIVILFVTGIVSAPED